MAIKSGLAAQIGYGEEVTWGTEVTPNRFSKLISENLRQEISRIESDSIIAGRTVRDSSQWDEGAVRVLGDVQHAEGDREAAFAK